MPTDISTETLERVYYPSIQLGFLAAHSIEGYDMQSGSGIRLAVSDSRESFHQLSQRLKRLAADHWPLPVGITGGVAIIYACALLLEHMTSPRIEIHSWVNFTIQLKLGLVCLVGGLIALFAAINHSIENSDAG